MYEKDLCKVYWEAIALHIGDLNECVALKAKYIQSNNYWIN